MARRAEGQSDLQSSWIVPLTRLVQVPDNAPRKNVGSGP